MCKFLNEWTRRNGSMNDNAMDDGLVVVTKQTHKHEALISDIIHNT